MGLFDFLKKNRNVPLSVTADTNNSGERTSVFKGDLAFIQDTDNVHTGYSSESTDSIDSVVYMSFAPITRKTWICPECGTRNEESLNGCIVCGLRK